MKSKPHSTTHRENLARLARIEGPIRGIQRMIEEGAYCIDICTQIQAVRTALHVLGLKILRKHLRSCLATAARRRSGRDFELKVEEIMRLTSRVVPVNYARIIAIGLVVLGAMPTAVTGQANEPLSLDGAVREALRSNPSVAEARARVNAISQRLQVAAAFPNPMLRYGVESASRSPSSDTAEHRFMVAQTLPWFGKRALRIEAAGAETEAAFNRWKATAQEVVAQVKQTFFDLQATQQSRALVQEQQKIVRQAIAIAQTRYASTRGSLARLSRDEAELAMLERRELDLATRESELTHQLNRLLDRPAETPVILQFAEIPAEVAENIGALEQANPELRVGEADLRRRVAERALMRKNFQPDVTVGLDYRALPIGEDMAMITVGVELPLWQRPLHARVREAAAMVQAGNAALENIQRRVEAEVDSAAAALRNALHSLELLRQTQLPQIEAETAAAEAAYRGGRGDFLKVLDAALREREARIQEVMAAAEVGREAARLEQALGTVAVPFDNEER